MQRTAAQRDRQLGKLPPLVDIPLGARAICANCVDARACPNTSVCCGGEVTVNITRPCPRGYWAVTEGK